MGALSGSGAMVGNYTGSGVTIVTLGYTNNNGSYSGVIANGTGDTVYLVKTGSGTQVLSGASSYSGGTTIGTSNGGTTVGGIVLIANSQALGTGNVTITAGNPASTGLGAQLQLAGGITVTNPAMTISGYGFGADNGVICNTSGNNTITGASASPAAQAARPSPRTPGP